MLFWWVQLPMHGSTSLSTSRPPSNASRSRRLCGGTFSRMSGEVRVRPVLRRRGLLARRTMLLWGLYKDLPTESWVKSSSNFTVVFSEKQNWTFLWNISALPFKVREFFRRYCSNNFLWWLLYEIILPWLFLWKSVCSNESFVFMLQFQMNAMENSIRCISLQSNLLEIPESCWPIDTILERVKIFFVKTIWPLQ